MLLSTCPNCNARFRVAPEQLNVRQGHVMCGRCRHVFNAFESLKRVEDEPQQEPIDYAIVAGAGGQHDAPELTTVESTVEQQAFDHAPTQTTVSSTPDGHEQLEATAASVEVPPPIPTPEEQFDEDLDRTIPEAPAPSEALPQNSDSSLLHQQSEKATDDPVAIPESFRPQTANPLISGKIPSQQKPSAVWRWLAALAALTLIAQATYEMTRVYRAWLVQHLPQAASVVATVCDAIGCVMPLGRDVNAIKVESSDLVEQPGKPGRILLSAIVANRGVVKQSFPILEVVLTDAKETVIASRVLQPAAYLGRVPSQEEGIAPNTELYINLNLDLSGGATASGYAVRVFYP